MNKPGLLKHILKCFTYAVCQNIGASKKLASQLDTIPDHLHGMHENCGTWCTKPDKPQRTHKFLIKNEDLYDDLKRLFGIYSENSIKYCINASSQANESVNNIITHQLPKSKCLSKSSSSDIRVGSGILVKNDGPTYVTGIKKGLGVRIHTKSEKYFLRAYKKRVKNAIRCKSLGARRRRMEIRKESETSRKSLENQEGTMYQSNIGFELDLLNNSYSADSSTPPSACKIVFFDLETSGVDRKSCEILQIAAKVDDYSFSTYVRPQLAIPAEASAVNSIEIIDDKLCYNKAPVHCVSIVSALEAFIQFLGKFSAPCLLVAHNATFDADILLREVRRNSMILDYSKVIYGFVDSLPVFKKILPKRKGTGMFKRSKLAEDFLPPSTNQDFHEGLFDCKILQELIAVKVTVDLLYENIMYFKDRMQNAITGKKNVKKRTKGTEKSSDKKKEDERSF